MELSGKCLILVPHPDDEMIGAGGVLINHHNCFDSYCVSSSGIPSVDGKYSAEERNRLRLLEWNAVMKKLDVHSLGINSTFGDNFPFLKELNERLPELNRAINITDYDCIFVPNLFEHHEEHRFVTYVLLPYLLKHQKHKKNVQIYQYEVWALMPLVNESEDITSVINKKIDILQMYKSQLDYTDYDKRIEGLNRYRGLMCGRVDYAEAYWKLTERQFMILRNLFDLSINIKRKFKR